MNQKETTKEEAIVEEFKELLRLGGDLIDYEGNIRNDDTIAFRKKIYKEVRTALLSYKKDIVEERDRQISETIKNTKIVLNPGYPITPQNKTTDEYRTGYSNALKDILQALNPPTET